MRRASLISKYKTSFSTSFPGLLLLVYFCTIIARSLYLTCTRVSSEIARFIFQETNLQTRAQLVALTVIRKGEYPSILKKQNLGKRNLCLFSIFLLPQKILPQSRKYKTFLTVRARFNVLCMVACCYLLLLEFLKKIMHRALHHRFIREFEREKVSHGETSFFLSTMVHAICAYYDQNI